MKKTLKNIVTGIALANAVSLGACTSNYGEVLGAKGVCVYPEICGEGVKGLNGVDLRGDYENQPGSEIKGAVGVVIYPGR